MAALLDIFIFGHDRPVVQGYPDGCQHRLQTLLRLRPYPMRGRRLLWVHSMDTLTSYVTYTWQKLLLHDLLKRLQAASLLLLVCSPCWNLDSKLVLCNASHVLMHPFVHDCTGANAWLLLCVCASYAGIVN